MTVKISDLPSLDALASNDSLPVVDQSSSTTKQVTGQQVLDFVEAALVTPLEAIVAYRGDNTVNPVINGAMNVWQRGVSFTAATLPINSDDKYLMDRWYILTDGNDIIDVTREGTIIPTGGLYATRLDVETVNKKFGIAQIIEQRNCVGFIGQTCTLSFKAKVSATTKLDNLKAAIVAWSGTADTVTSDIISAWGVEGTNPTLIANATYENTPVNLVPSTSYATYSVTAAIDTASAANIILFIWSDVTDTTLGDFLYITDVKLEVGSAVSAFIPRLFQDELSRCQRYYEKSFDYDTAPAQSLGSDTGEYAWSATNIGAVNISSPTYSFKVTKRVGGPASALAVTTYNVTAANAQIHNATDAVDCTNTAVTSKHDSAFRLTATGNAGQAVGELLWVHWTADAEL